MKFSTPLVLLFALTPALFAAGEERKVDEVFARFNRTDSPGCSVAVARDGRIVFKRGYGMANLDHDVIITPATIFHVASVSKQFTAFSVLLLQEQGKLSIDDEVHKYLPELPRFKQPITLRQLMNHTSGLRDQWSMLELSGWRYSEDLITDDDVMEVITKQRDLNFTPGSEHLYSNTGYTLMALVVKKVSGKSLREFTTENIFKPLGMNDTHFRDDFNEIVKGQAYGYRPSQGDTYRLSVTNFNTTGATSLLTTAEDLLRWHFNFEKPVVGAAVLPRMTERGKLTNGKDIDYAAGLSVGTYRGLPTVGHGGSDAGYRADFLRFPEQKFAVACACNVANANPGMLTRRVAEIYLESAMTPPAAKPEASKLEGPAPEVTKSLEGVYWNKERDAYRRFGLRDGKLFGLASATWVALTPSAGGVFSTAPGGPQIRFEKIEAGSPNLMREILPGATGEGQIYTRVPAANLSVDDLKQYEGVYRGDEIDIPYRLSVTDGKLTVRITKHKPFVLEPLIADVFGSDSGRVRFTRDANGRVAGFMLTEGRVRDLKFSKQ